MMFRLSIAGTAAWKLGLIPVLATVLFKVTRPSASEETPPEPSAQTDASPAGQVVSKSALALPELSLGDALKFNPFSTLPLPARIPEERPVEEPVTALESPEPAQPPGPMVNPLVEKAATLKQLKVSAVFPSPKGSVAIIDSKTVGVGELLSPGVRVVEIRGTDVILRVEDGGDASGTVMGGAGPR